ncbi:MAG TPA: PQQ-binding-like beta-propeller repeat protein [Streptosporangiaceae bacterium]
MDPLAPDDPREVGGYRLRARLGSGGMGRVYLGYSPSGRAVAVKVIHAELAANPAFRVRFSREVAAARLVSGVYTAPVAAAGPDDDPPWLATLFVAGPSLAEAVKAAGPLPMGPARRLAVGLVEALAEIHGHGLVHRDLKPANVLLAIDGPRVIDFGISRAMEKTAMTASGIVVGTPAFMSPEQAAGGAPVRPASDVFSLGGLIVFASTGTGPFGTGPVLSLLYRVVHAEPTLDAVPPGLRDVAAACLAKKPEDRPTLRQVMDAITTSSGPHAGSLASFWPETVAGMIRSYQLRLDAELSRRDAKPQPAPGAGRSPTVASHLSERTIIPAPAEAASAPAPLLPDPHAAERETDPLAGPDDRPEAAAAMPPTITSVKIVTPPPQPAAELAPEASPPARPADRPQPEERPRPAGHPEPAEPPRPTARQEPAERSLPAGPPEPADQPGPPGRLAPAVTRRRLLAGLGGLAAVGLAVTGWELSQGGGPAPGTEIWSSGAGGGPAGPLAVAGGTVVFSARPAPGQRGGRLYALRASDGATMWSSGLGRGVVTGPAAAGGVVYFGGHDNRVYALHAATGRRIWSSGVGGWVATDPVAGSGVVYVGGGNTVLYALRAADGRPSWSRPIGGGPVSDPAVTGGVIYIGGQNISTLFALRATDGRPVREIPVSGGWFTSPAVSGGVIYIGGGVTTLNAMRALDGKPIWARPVGVRGFPLPAVADGVVYVSGDDGRLYALHASHGAPAWSSPAGGGPVTGPVAADGVVYFGGRDGQLHALAAADGTQAWTFALAGGAGPAPVLADGVLYAAGRTRLYALHA